MTIVIQTMRILLLFVPILPKEYQQISRIFYHKNPQKPTLTVTGRRGPIDTRLPGPGKRDHRLFTYSLTNLERLPISRPKVINAIPFQSQESDLVKAAYVTFKSLG